MRKTIFVAILMVLSWGAMTAFAGNTDTKSTSPVTTENKLSAEEITRLTNRIEEIRGMDKSKLTATEKLQLRKEVKEIKEKVKADGVYLYVSGVAILLIILLILLLL